MDLSLRPRNVGKEQDCFKRSFQTAPTDQGTPSSSDEEVGSSQKVAVRTPLTRSATRGTGVEHQSLPYIRGPKKTVVAKQLNRNNAQKVKMASAEQLAQIRQEADAQAAARH